MKPHIPSHRIPAWPGSVLKQSLVPLLLVTLLTGADWRQFRGTDNRAVAPDGSLPVVWQLGDLDRENADPRPPDTSETNISQANILRAGIWRVELPGRGPSSPIVVDGRVFVTASSGADQDQLHALCFDARTGRRMWQRKFWATGRTLCHPISAIAAPTPASDGRRIFAFYSSCDLVCFDLNGNLLWYRCLAHDYPRVGNDTGMSSSPLVIGNTVIVQVESQGNSFAMGIDVETGLNRWRIPRRSEENWSSPALYQSKQGQSKQGQSKQGQGGAGQGGIGGHDMALLQSTWGLTLLEPNTGRVHWQYELPCEAIPSTVVAEGILYVASSGMTALDVPDHLFLDGVDLDLTGATIRVLWRENRLATGSSSPVVHQGKLYTVNGAGVLNCGDAASGRVLWRLRLQGRFWATPVMAGSHLYLANSDGLIQVVWTTDTRGTLVGTCNFGEPIQATPAISDGTLFFRSDRHLWGISGPP